MSWNLLTKRRDDLPEMRWPLVLVTVAAACLTGGGALALRHGAAVLTVPMLVISAAAYTLLILLWRRLAALAVSAGIGAVVLLTGGGWMQAVCCGLCLLVVSYVYAALFLSKETRFVRIASAASAVGICLLLTAAAWISWRFGAVGDAIVYFCDLYREAANTGLQAFYTMTDSPAVILLPETVNAILYQAVAAVPALAGMVCILLAGVTDRTIRFLFWLLDCGEYFSAEADEGITIPRSFGVLYGILLFLVMGTSASSSPYLYSILSNCHWIFALPCAWVGVSMSYRKLRHSLAEASFYGMARRRSPLPAVLILVFFVMLLGISAAFTVLAVLGALFIASRRDKPRES